MTQASQLLFYLDIVCHDLMNFVFSFPPLELTTWIILLPQPPEVWHGGVGFVSKEMIQTHCPAPASDIQVRDLTIYICFYPWNLFSIFLYLASYICVGKEGNGLNNRDYELILILEYADSEVWSTTHEQGHGRSPRSPWIYIWYAVPILILFCKVFNHDLDRLLLLLHVEEQTFYPRI